MVRSLTLSPTAQGLLALFLWSTSASALSFLKVIPQYELLMVGCFLASISTLVKVAWKREWTTLKAPLVSWLLVISGIVLQQFLYVAAISQANPAEVDILVYLWPVMVVFMSALFFKEKVRLRHIVGLGFGLTAVAILSKGRITFESFSIGHICAILSAITWSVYTVFARHWSSIHYNMLGVGYGLGFLLSSCLHLQFETFIVPSVSQTVILLYFGLALTIGAFSLWTNGIQHGHAKFLAISAYVKPVVSLFLLSAIGYTSFSWHLLMACLFVILAGFAISPDIKLDAQKWLAEWTSNSYTPTSARPTT